MIAANENGPDAANDRPANTSQNPRSQFYSVQRTGASCASPIDAVLGRLEKVHRRQPGQWSARCPAHDDKGPSLSVRETPEGACLLHCFAGCAVADVVAALGLELHDLFPTSDRPVNAPKKIAKVLTAGQALELLADESLLVAVAAGNVAHGVQMHQADTDRLMVAAGRIAWLRHECGGLYA